MVRVKIYSSGAQFGPLKPVAPLRYDMRNVTNPPRQLRGSMDGRSKKLRDPLMNNKDFIALLETIQNDILREVERLEQLQAGCGKEVSGVGAYKEVNPTHEIQQDRVETEHPSPIDTDLDDKEHLVSDDYDMKNETRISDTIEYLDNESEPVLIVNCFCHSGRHRSASMVEELARLKWPAGTNIEIIHRDIDEDRRKQRKQRQVRKSVRMLRNNEYAED